MLDGLHGLGCGKLSVSLRLGAQGARMRFTGI
jgi:hypothetical protein